VDWKTEVWVQLADDGSPMAMSVKLLAQRIRHTRYEPSVADTRSVTYALKQLKKEGLVECRRVDGNDQKIEWFSRDKIKAILYGNRD